MKHTKLFGIAVAMLSLTGCAQMQQMHEEWLAKHCVPAAAYNQGMTDGLKPGVEPQNDYAMECSENNNAINRAYLNGYYKGIRNRPVEINVNKKVTLTENTNKERQKPAGQGPKGRTKFSLTLN